ncbi:MAG TPA: hypothetical protein VNT92_04825, partial [Acidimicrobiia bacterium]|nr:hypothetical protein [Acidimicrobiia bacterium]
TPDATAAEVEARVRAAVSSPDLGTAATTIAVYCEPDPRDLLDGSRIRIDVTHDVDMITPIVGPFLGGEISLSQSAEADRFFDNCPADAPAFPGP